MVLWNSLQHRHSRNIEEMWMSWKLWCIKSCHYKKRSERQNDQCWWNIGSKNEMVVQCCSPCCLASFYHMEWINANRIPLWTATRSFKRSGKCKFPLAVGEDDVNISQIIHLLELGIKVILITSVQALQKCRHDLLYKLYGAAKELAEFNQKFDNQMFGPKMKSDKHCCSQQDYTEIDLPNSTWGNN